MDVLLPLGAAAAAITKYLYWLSNWSAGFPPRADSVAEAHSKDLLSLSVPSLNRQKQLAGARPGKSDTVGTFMEEWWLMV